MLVPLVFPEGLQRAAVGQPVRVHEIHEFSLPALFYNLGDVVVLGCLVAVCGIGAVAEIGPSFAERLAFMLPVDEKKGEGAEWQTRDRGESSYPQDPR